jgi:NADH-quinone oxidoreductase subunit M
LVGVVYDRVHHRDLNQFGGLFGKMPVYSGFATEFSSPLAYPACAVYRRSTVVLSVWSFSQAWQ